MPQHAPSEDIALRPGLRIDALIARGTFGIVFRGRQLTVDREVAIKVLHVGFAMETEPKRLFRDEIRAIGMIDHRNVVRLLEADDTPDGRLYFVMELLDGPTLQQLAEQGPMASARASALVGQLLDGLAAVHEAGHIHADVKPSNAVVVGTGSDERVVLIDFGLSRLRRADKPAEAVGGTRAYMAPEQLRSWEVDARSDVFSAALVLLRLVTGWQREEHGPVVPPLDEVNDPALRAALERALAIEPSRRPTAADFARALRGGPSEEEAPSGPRPPFRELAPMTERDRGRLYGRAADITRLARRIDSDRALVFTGPSGTGKTSLLRAGLVPLLDAKGIISVYISCEAGATAALAPALDDAATRKRRLVVILDQLETLLAGEGQSSGSLVEELLARVRAARTEVAIVLAVREDFVARLLATPALSEGVPQVRLGPLDRDGARAALVEPLAEHGVVIEAELLAMLLDELVRAGSEVGSDLGWPTSTVFPPHLQLAGAALFDVLAPNDKVVTSAHYRRLGGFDAIVGEHLARCLDELSEEDRAVARELFLALVATARTRAIRGEAELVEAASSRHSETRVRSVLQRLEAHRLITRRIDADGTASWSLVHDTLVPRIEAWFTVIDLDRRRVAEMVRFYLRQSQDGGPAMLGTRQLRALVRYPDLVDDLEAEWVRRPGAVWTPKLLVARSRQAMRYRRAIAGTIALAVAAITALLVVRWLDERAERQREERLRDLNLGRFDLVLVAFDWHDGVKHPIDIAELPALDWELHDANNDDPQAYGSRVNAPRLVHGSRAAGDAGTLIETGIQARGGGGFLVVTHRGRIGEKCAPSIVPVRRLPGYSDRATLQLRIDVPTCRATRDGMIAIPEGRFVWGGLGDPPARFGPDNVPPERVVDLPAYSIDRSEITNAAFAVFAAMASVHDVVASQPPHYLKIAGGANYARADIDWYDARAYCRFLGKELPTSMQWQKALRGGIVLPDGRNNPYPNRNLPWGDPVTTEETARRAAIAPVGTSADRGRADDPRRPFPVAAFATTDVSPYGVVDLAGGLQEWTSDLDNGDAPESRRARLTRGGNWYDTEPETLKDYMAIQNSRTPRWHSWAVGARCAVTE